MRRVDQKMGEEPPPKGQYVPSKSCKDSQRERGQLSCEQISELKKRIWEYEFEIKEREWLERKKAIGYSFCNEEKVTRQILGFESRSNQPPKVVRYFRY